jgi:hypothetical protein
LRCATAPRKDIDCDLIYGRNLTGEVANWITVGCAAANAASLNSMPIGATVWIAANWAIPPGVAETRRTAARDTPARFL